MKRKKLNINTLWSIQCKPARHTLRKCSKRSHGGGAAAAVAYYGFSGADVGTIPNW
ncbi:hypothetical protein [Serratia fonticola]|uniref:hypothetical protein n=1 Tax=Serratia fonticola TaxID=47917 RepID=UPI000E2AF40D|nr:hypothetical protein [Serratia fonticola]RDL15639.1 hypothetical protein DFO62_12350 [Serratia fonticola]